MTPMRVRSAVLVGILCLLVAAVASADISRVSPSSFTPTGEDYLTIFGSGFLGTEATLVRYDGEITIEPQSATNTQVFVWVPVEVKTVEGPHTVEVLSVDATGTRVHGPATFTIELPPLTGPPFLNTPEVQVVEAVDATGADVMFEVTAFSQDGTELTPTCTPASGSHFSIGSHNVSCSATDSFGTTTRSFLVIVADSTPPVLTMPDDIVTDNPVVTFAPTAVDNIDGSVPVTCTPASGSTFPTGTTRVRCVARDAHLNETVGILLVQVTSGPPPLILPDDIVAEATSAAGAVVTYEVSIDGTGTFSCTPASGSTFAIGTTTVNCSATNSFGTTTGSFTVTVQDTTAPVLTTPAVLHVEATSAAGAIATWVATAVDAVDGDRPVTCDPASGTFFAFGTTTVVCTAADTRGNDTSNAFDVIVEDTTPPEILNLTATPNLLTPPNHRMVDVTVSATAVDTVDPAPTLEIISVTSNQADNGTGDGDEPGDIVFTGGFTMQLRAERSHGIDRIYTITVQATDASGNVSTATVLVRASASKSRPSRR